MEDSRNVADEFKGMEIADIVAVLDARGIALEIAIENTLRDYNMGAIVRNANAFGVRTVHVIGRKQWNKRGAMKTDAYVHIRYHDSIASFVTDVKGRNMPLYAIDNNCESASIASVTLPEKMVMIFGQEGPGISEELRAVATQTLHIPQLGSTRSMNVGVASGIAMYEWSRQHNKLQ